MSPGPMGEDGSNPLQMADQGVSAGDEPVEPVMTEWKQPYSTGPEAPTSSPKNPPQPRNTGNYPEAEAQEEEE